MSVVCCWLVVARCLPCAVRCLLFVVEGCWLVVLVVRCCSLFDVGWLLLFFPVVGCRLLLLVCWLTVVARCLIVVACCVLFAVCWLVSDVVRCALFVVCCLLCFLCLLCVVWFGVLFGVCCVLHVVRCSLVAVRCRLLVAWRIDDWWLAGACCLLMLCVLCYLLYDVRFRCSLLFVVCCLLFAVCCLLFVAWCVNVL